MRAVAEKLVLLREQLRLNGVNGFIVPHADEFQSEYLPPSAERLAYITDFTGSAGAAIVMESKAVAMTDGRYTIQIRRQVESAYFEIADSTQVSLADWLFLNATRGQVIGYDPRLHTAKQIEELSGKLSLKGILLKALPRNPIDVIWTDRPAPPMAEAEIFPDTIAGLTSLEKRERVSEAVLGSGARAVVLTLPDSIAWLLNVRGHDVDHNPLVLSNAILHAETAAVDWFVDEQKVPDLLREHLGERVSIFLPQQLEQELGKLKGPVLVDFSRSSLWHIDTLKAAGVEVLSGKDPCILFKACKSGAEQNAMRSVHIRDGVAMVRFLSWLDAQDFSQAAHSEISLAEKLEAFRKADPYYRDSSFDTICGWAQHGAIIHYRAMPETFQTIGINNLLLLDSGGQYADGTTDVTRTVVIGVVGDEVKDRFTRVLKGHINLARARFPQGTVGAQLDTFAREALWEVGLDYAHGTGHGVGCYLSVHEEAASISPRGADPVRVGMILSNEPGYYEEGAYGIRHENLLLCHESGALSSDGRNLLHFETLTLVPFDRRGITVSLLRLEEREWLNAYHARVRETLLPYLDEAEQAWLIAATRPV